MQTNQRFTGSSENELWPQLQADLARNPDELQYRALLDWQGKPIEFIIDIDLGGGFEGGSAFTSFTAPVHAPDGFLFGLHRAHFLDELGKFLGMQDVEIGAPDFDQNIIVKSNDETRVRALLSDASLRASLLALEDFTLEITQTPTSEVGGASQLVLMVEDGVIESERLRPLFHAFFHMLTALESSPVV